MKIAIDTNILNVDKSGAGVYTKKLIENLKKIDTENQYYFFSYGADNNIKDNIFRRKFDNLIRDTLWSQIILPKKLKEKRVDLLHCPAFKATLKPPVPLVVTFYDLHILKNPQDYKLWLRLYCKFMLSKIAKIAKKIITISDYSKKDIMSTFRIPERNVVVTHCGIDTELFKILSDAKLKQQVTIKYGLKRKFIIYVGSIQPRKNIPALINSFYRLRKNRNFDYQLIFVGGTGWRNKNIFSLIKELNLQDRIKFLGYVPDQDLAVIYNLADFLVYPSFFEGFGMPILESMACGCPVIATNTSSIPEVIGKAGIMVNPNNLNELINAMLVLSKDECLRKKLIIEGIENIKRFSWEKCARETLQAYQEALF